MQIQKMLLENEYTIHDNFSFDSYEIYKIEKDGSFAYFIADEDKITHVSVPKNQFFNCDVLQVADEGMILTKENLFENGVPLKDVPIPLWLAYDTNVFDINMRYPFKYDYDWTPGEGQTIDDMPSHEDFLQYAPEKIMPYPAVYIKTVVSKNFIPVFYLEESYGCLLRKADESYMFKSLISDLKEHGITYTPTRDIVTITANSNHKETLEKKLEELIPPF